MKNLTLLGLLSLFLVSWSSSGQITNRISQYPNTNTLNDSDLFLVGVTNIAAHTNKNIKAVDLRTSMQIGAAVPATAFLTNWGNTLSNLSYTLSQAASNLSYAIGSSLTNFAASKQNGTVLQSNLMAMGISNILAASGIALATNGGVLWITNTSTGIAAQNGFGNNTTLTNPVVMGNIHGDGSGLTNMTIGYGGEAAHLGSLVMAGGGDNDLGQLTTDPTFYYDVNTSILHVNYLTIGSTTISEDVPGVLTDLTAGSFTGSFFAGSGQGFQGNGINLTNLSTSLTNATHFDPTAGSAASGPKALKTYSAGAGISITNETGSNLVMAVLLNLSQFIFQNGVWSIQNGAGLTNATLSGASIISASSNLIPISIKGVVGQRTNLLELYPAATGVFAASVASNGVYATQTGNSSTYARAGGTISVQTTPIANAGTAQTNLATYAVLGNTITNSGDRLHIRCAGRLAANTDTKEVLLIYGSTTLFDSTSQIVNVAGESYVIDAEIIDTGATSQSYSVSAVFSGTSLFTTTSAGSAAETNGISTTLKLAATCGGNGDVTNRTMTIDWIPTP